MSAADIANVDDATKEHLESYSYHLGMMFQIKDDLLDCYGDEAKLGKKKWAAILKIIKVRT